MQVKSRFDRLFGETKLVPNFIHKDPYTMCSILVHNGRYYVGAGFAKRNPIDPPNQALGEQIAYGRAMKDLVQNMGGEETVKEAFSACREARNGDAQQVFALREEPVEA